MNNRRRILTVVLAIVILAISVLPALAGADAGDGVGYFDLESRFPPGMLRAEGWE